MKKHMMAVLGVALAFAVGAAEMTETSLPEVWFTFDDSTVTGWQTNKGTFGDAISFCGSYSSKGKNGGATYVETSGECGAHSYSPWCHDISLGGVFTVSIRLRASTAANRILFCLGGLRGENEVLMLTTEDAQNLKLVVAKGTEILRQAVIPVDDVTQLNTYVLRYENGKVTASVEGVSESCCSIEYIHTQGVFQLLGGYNKQDEMPEYYHGCGVVNSYTWEVTAADTANVICDFRIWTGWKTVTVGELTNMTAAYTFSDGSKTVTGAVSGNGFLVPSGARYVQVTFMPEDGCRLFGSDSVYVGTVSADVVLSKEQLPVAKPVEASGRPGSAVINSITERELWSGKIDIDYKGVDIPENDACVSHINLQYRLSSAGAWINVPPEDYCQSSNWTEIIDGKLIHRIFNGADHLTWDMRKTLGTRCGDAQVRIAVFDLAIQWDDSDADSPPGLWPAKLLDLDLATWSITPVSDCPADLNELRDRAQNDAVYSYRSRHMLFREVPAGFFKRGDRYWHFGGTTYVGVFRMTEDQCSMIGSGFISGNQKLKKIALETLRGIGAQPYDAPHSGSLLGTVNDKIGGTGWRIDVLPDYAYGQRLLWAGKSACPVNDAASAKEYGDFGTAPMAGGKKSSDWGFYDLVSGQEWTLSANDRSYARFGATSADGAAKELNKGADCNTPESAQYAVRLVMYRQGTSIEVKEVSASSIFTSSDPASVCLNTHSEMTIAGTEAVAISYSGDDWGAGGLGVTVGYSWEGGAMQTLIEATDSGTFLWTPPLNGRYEFSHAVTGGATNTAVIVVNGLPGREDDPWMIGDGVTAYVKDRVLYLQGEGEVMEFGGDGAPWAGYDEVLNGIGPLSRAITVPASVLATLPISVKDGVPSGVISGADFETVQIVDGKAYLGVSVATNADLTAATKAWRQADIEDVRKESDGTVTLTVPATAEKGFMILKSKPANGK